MKLRYLNKPLVDQVSKRVQKFDFAYFEMTEWFDHFWNRFELFVLRDCEHYFEDDRNPYVDVTRSIQSNSTMIFFILVHIPLSRMHSTFGFLTAFIPIMLNIRTKYWFYETCNKLVCLIFKNDPEAKNHIKKPKDLKV